MRVKELADLAGTTVRTVRHYHHMGLLAVPARVGGVRDYGVERLARLLRIRWLVQAGLSLSTVAEVLPDQGRTPADAALEDLEATLRGIDERLAELTVQRERVAGLVDRARAGEGISPLPGPVALLYDRLAERMPPRARRVLEVERGIAAVFAVRGLLPAAATRLAEAITSDDEAAVTAMFEAFAELDSCPDEHVGEVAMQQMALVRDFVARHESVIADFVADFPHGVRGRAASAMLMRLMRLGFPASAQQQLIDRAFAEAATRPAIAAALEARAHLEEA
jgi:DNA-binding transcriptional MerR regulator